MCSVVVIHCKTPKDNVTQTIYISSKTNPNHDCERNPFDQMKLFEHSKTQ